MANVQAREVLAPEAPAPPVPRNPLKVLAFALSPGLAFMTVLIWRASTNRFGDRRFTLFDDAMISMTYARTLAETGELVWYPGAPRTQGFTNPLWTMYMAGLHVIGLDGSTASMVVIISGVVLILATASMVYLLVTRALHPEPQWHVFGAVAAGAVPLTYPLVFWTLRGMEVGLLALVLLVCLWAAASTSSPRVSDRGILLGGYAGAVGVLTRLDFVMLVIAIALCSAGWATGLARKARVSMILAGPALLAAVTELWLQSLYYGDWLPNTYRLKMEGVTTGLRVARGLSVSGKLAALLVVLLASFALVLIKGPGTNVRRLATLVMASVVVAVGYGVWVGGDAWEQQVLLNRYVSVILPAALVLVGVAAGTLYQRSDTSSTRWTGWLIAVPIAAVGAGLDSNPVKFIRGQALVSASACCLALGIFVAAIRTQPRFRSSSRAASALAVSALVVAGATVSAYPSLVWYTSGAKYSDEDQQKTQEGYALARVTGPSAVIATMWAGAPAYYSGRAMVDLLGKNDETIARIAPVAGFYPGHNKWDYAYSIGVLRPDVVFQPWLFVDSARENLQRWGYVEGCLGLDDPAPSFFRADSKAVRWDELTLCR